MIFHAVFSYEIFPIGTLATSTPSLLIICQIQSFSTMPTAANEDSSQVASALSNLKLTETSEESLARSFIGVIDKKIRNLCKRKVG